MKKRRTLFTERYQEVEENRGCSSRRDREVPGRHRGKKITLYRKEKIRHDDSNFYPWREGEEMRNKANTFRRIDPPDFLPRQMLPGLGYQKKIYARMAYSDRIRR